MISILVLTNNEELTLPGCLGSVSWSDDIHVFDSFSVDRTIEIARDAGACVTQHQFTGYASQRNAALDSLQFKYPWILILDADERVPEKLSLQMRQHIEQAPGPVSGFRIRRRDYLAGTWLKHAQISPFYIRLVRAGKAHYHREINEVVEISGQVKNIDGYFEHYPFLKGFSHWLRRHNEYSSLEAKRWIEERRAGERFSLSRALFSRDFTARRYHQKGLFYKLPARPFIKWAYMVFVRLAFLDGRAGMVYASLQAIYEYFIVLKTRELLDKP